MIKKDFVHLHLHSHYSLSNGIESIENLVERAYKYNMQALALTDHNSLAGAIEFTKHCNRRGIKPILGCEITISSKRPSKYKSNYFHLVLLVENEYGYKNLVKLLTKAHSRNIASIPFITYEELKEHKKGLISLTGCDRGELISAIIENRTQDVEETFKDFLSIFSKENLYIELQNYQRYRGIDVNKILLELASFLELPIIATQNVHYLDKKDHLLYNFIQSTYLENVTNTNPIISSLSNRDKSFLSIDEIYKLFSYLPDTIENTLEISQRCCFQLNISKKRFFEHDLSRGLDPDSYLWDFVAKKYYELDKKSKERLNNELQIVKELGISNLFIILIRIHKFLLDKNIEAFILRGWLAHSLIAFLIGINKVNPYINNLELQKLAIRKSKTLLLELEIASDYIKPLITFVFEQYPNSAICLEGQYVCWKKNELLNSFYNWITTNNSIDQLNEVINCGGNSDLYEQITNYAEEEVDKHSPLPKSISNIENTIIFSGEPLSELIPINLTDTNLSITQYSSPSINELGLIKLKLIDSISLNIINDTLRFIKEDNKSFTLDKIPLSDEKTYNLLSKRLTNGIPILHNIIIKSELKNKKPQNYEQLQNVMLSYSKEKNKTSATICNTYISYCLAYLKANFPEAFYASALTYYSNNINCYNILYEEAKSSGISFLPIDINCSDFKFLKQGELISIGLCLIKNLSPSAYQEIDKFRRGGTFNSLTDLVKRTARKVITPDILKSCIMSGALDSLNPDRNELLSQIENLEGEARTVKRKSDTYYIIEKNKDKITISQKKEFNKKLLELELEATGTTLSQTLFEYYLPFSKLIGAIKPEEFQYISHRQQTSVYGIIDQFKGNRNIKKDNSTCFDIQGTEVRISEEILQRDREQIECNAPVLVVGRKIIGTKGEYLFAKRIYDIRRLIELAETPHTLELDLSTTDLKKQKQLIKILNQYKGNHKVFIKDNDYLDKVFLKKIEKHSVLCCPTLISELSDLLGENNIKISLDFKANQ